MKLLLSVFWGQCAPSRRQDNRVHMSGCLPFKFLTIASYSTGFGFLIAKLASHTLHIWGLWDYNLLLWRRETCWKTRKCSFPLLTSCWEKKFALLVLLAIELETYWAGYDLLISNSIYISCFLWLCSDWGRTVKGSSFAKPSTDHAKLLILLERLTLPA